MVRAEKPLRLRLSPAKLSYRTFRLVALATQKYRLAELTENCENKLSLLDVCLAMFADGERDHKTGDARHEHADAN